MPPPGVPINIPQEFEPHIIWCVPEELRVSGHNARTHDSRQIQQIAASIQEFGFTNPILVDHERFVLAGHGRLAAARHLELSRVPTIELSPMSEAQKRAYMLADNRLAELAGWDDTLLATELEFLISEPIEFSAEITGFDMAEIDLLIDAQAAVAPSEDDEIPELDEESAPVSRTGDVWELGKHRLLCGDALDTQCYQALLNGRRAQRVFTDPPYNVPIGGNVCGSGRIQHPEFAMASGEMSEEEFRDFPDAVLSHLAAHSEYGSIHYVCMDWRHIADLLDVGRRIYTEVKNLCVWNKDNGGMGTFYRSKFELVAVFKNGLEPHINNFGLGERGRYRTDVWDYAGVNTQRKGRLEELAMHPTVKPVAMVADAMRDCSHRGGLILDPFAGSGTTILAAERTGRIARALEIAPRYVDVCVKRWERATGNAAVLHGTGLNFGQVTAQRTSSAARIRHRPVPGATP